MNLGRRLLSAVLALACAVACAGGGPSAPRLLLPLSGFLAGASDLGEVDPARPVSLLLQLADPTAEARAADLAAVYDPRSPRFGAFMTPSQMAGYGPDPAAVQLVMADIGNAGLSGEWRPGNPWLVVRGPAIAIAREFRVDIHDYAAVDGTRFYAAAALPAVPQGWSGVVAGIEPISSYTARLRPHVVPPGGLKPVDAGLAYDTKPLRDQGIDGSGQTVVLWALGEGFNQKDLDAFAQKYGLPPIQVVLKGQSRPSQVGEIEMDIEVVHAIAPGARIVVYTDAPVNNANIVSLEDKFITDNPGAIISQSWGECEFGWGRQSALALDSIFAKADQLGSQAFFSTGDAGAFGCIGTSPPAPRDVAAAMPSALPSVTAVGGTRISVRTDGSWLDETVWEDVTATAGSGGGVSTLFRRPGWQAGPGVDNQYNGRQMRSVPDVAADADPVSGLALRLMGSTVQGGGTSQASPLWAGFTALIKQYLAKQGVKPVGFLNPALYQLAANKQPYPPFHDVTVGSNLVYPATPGYDLATGLGSPDVWNLARDLEAYQKAGGTH